MKKNIILIMLSVLTLSIVFAQHFVPVTDPSASLFPGQVYVYNALINDVLMEAWDEIGIFDGDLCVGSLVLTGPIIDTMTPIVYAVYAGPSDPGAVTGHFIYLRIWDNSAQVEYAYPEMSVQFAMPPTFLYNPEWIITFANGGTTQVETISYETPTAFDTEPITALSPFYTVTNIDFQDTGVTLLQGTIMAQMNIQNSMTVYAFDENSPDTYYQAIEDDITEPILGGTVPEENYSSYGWFIDSDGINFYADADYPIIISFDLSAYGPSISDPTNLKIYRREIHGTSFYYEVPTAYDPVTQIATVTLTSADMLPGEFIVGSLNPDDVLPVELSSFTAIMNNSNNAVNLFWVSQTESNMIGYRIYRGLNETLAEALDQNVLIEATNTSQPTTYMYADTDIASETQYHYWLEAVDMDGTSQIFGPIYIITPSGSFNNPEIPLVTGLDALYPNPFNPDLTINYTVERSYPVEIFVTNIRGQRIRTLVSASKDRGRYSLVWNGRDDNGRQCSSGVYYIKMTAGNEKFNRKAILMK